MYKIIEQSHKVFDENKNPINLSIKDGEITIGNLDKLFININKNTYRSIVYSKFFIKILEVIKNNGYDIQYEGDEFTKINNMLHTFLIWEKHFSFKIKIEDKYIFFSFEIYWSSKRKYEICDIEIYGEHIYKYSEYQNLPENLKYFFDNKRKTISFDICEVTFYDELPNFDLEYLDKISNDISIIFLESLKKYNCHKIELDNKTNNILNNDSNNILNNVLNNKINQSIQTDEHIIKGNSITEHIIILKYNDEHLNINIENGHLRIDDLYKLLKSITYHDYCRIVNNIFYDIFYNKALRNGLDIKNDDFLVDYLYYKKRFSIKVNKYNEYIYFDIDFNYSKIRLYWMGINVLETYNNMNNNKKVVPDKILIEAIDFYNTSQYFPKKLVSYINIPIYNKSNDNNQHIKKYNFIEYENIAIEIADWLSQRVIEYK
jgi:hypothetical protein